MSESLDVRPPTGTPARVVDTLLRSLGGGAVMLRVPTPALAGHDMDQLGLTEPGFEQIPIGPAVCRRVMGKVQDGKGERVELLVSATIILDVVSSLEFDSPGALFAQAAGVVMNGTLFQITDATSSEILGQPYLYRLQLRGALREVV